MVHPSLRKSGPSRRDPEARLEEAVGLARAIGLEIAWSAVVQVTRPRSATLLGKGLVSEFGAVIGRTGAALAVVDATLSPIQQRNLELAWSCKVIDRTGLILEIFGERARTKEGQLQVELAALTYQRTRLVRSWTHLERQRGGFGFLGGPGESQLEIDRRLITERISRIKADLEQVVRTRSLHRKARKRVPLPVIALVGYTNAGKSTLFNRLTNATVEARDQLFATLDPTMRRIELPGGEAAILSDTVGFISDLPTGLIAAFRATLEEVLEADLILHVRDISHPDSAAQRDDVLAVLGDLGLDETLAEGLFEVLNKIDLVPSDQKEFVLTRSRAGRRSISVSARTGEGSQDLRAAIGDRLRSCRQTVELSVSLNDGAALAWLYDKGCVLERSDDQEAAHLRVRLDPADLARFERRHSGAVIARVPATPS